MFQKRKEYRTNFSSSGQLYVAGELLDLISYDVSTNGMMVEVIPGSLLTDINDFEALLKETHVSEIYVKDLMLTGDVEIVWVKLDNERILLGLKFRNVMSNAVKLWRKRRYYRSKRKFSGYLVTDEKRIDFEGNNVSTEGMEIKLDQVNNELKPGTVVKLIIKGLEIKGVGKIVWINTAEDGVCVLGLRYLTIG